MEAITVLICSTVVNSDGLLQNYQFCNFVSYMSLPRIVFEFIRTTITTLPLSPGLRSLPTDRELIVVIDIQFAATGSTQIGINL